MRLQSPEDRERKGAVVVIQTRHSYTSLEAGIVTYSRLGLDRVVRTSTGGPGGRRRVIVTERAGKVYGPGTQVDRVFTIDKPVRADDLWAEHAGSSWSTPAEVRDAVAPFVA